LPKAPLKYLSGVFFLPQNNQSQKGETNPMENTNKMKNLTNDLKAFEQMMKEQRKEKRAPKKMHFG